MIIGILLSLAWTYWFFYGTFNIYKTSSKVYVTKKEYLTGRFKSDGSESREIIIRKRIVKAEFDAADLQYMNKGQKGFLYLEEKKDGYTGAISVYITGIEYSRDMNYGTAVLGAEIDAGYPNPFEQGMGGFVKIIVDRTTPAKIILESSTPGIKKASPDFSKGF